ncbi:MAG: glutamate racemase [Bacteroidales bacterium]|nr:glutamate racemase [Bacteroidales bacterium]
MTERQYNIGVFDSGFGGLSILKEIRRILPEYSYIYLGDNARAPYGTRSFETVYRYTLEAVTKLFEMECSLIIIACNTASAKALRNIQQRNLHDFGDNKRVLGIIRPCTEIANTFTKNNNLGIVATKGTVTSKSYEIEIQKFFPNIQITAHACPMWVPIVENGEYASDGADFFVKKEIDALLTENPNIDALLLGCTHYPLLLPKIRKYLPEHIAIVQQGEIVAHSLQQYLQKHTALEASLKKNGAITFYTTDSQESFNAIGSHFLSETIQAQQIQL